MDGGDVRLLLGVLAVSVGVLWAAAILGLAVLVFRLIGGV
jgi:hypothetical protein